MPKTPKFIHKLTSYGWQVDVPESMSGTGDRSRRYFKEEKEAKKFAAGLRARWNEGQRGGIIPAALAMIAAEAHALLDPYGLTLLDAAKAAVDRIKASGSSETFQDRYDRALRENEEHWRPRYMADMEKLPRWVGKAFMESMISELDKATIDKALRANGATAASTLDMRRRYVSAIMGHQTRHRRTSEVQIMTTEQIDAMLAACKSPEEKRTVGLLLWAGIRPDAEGGEIARLQWESVGKSEIYVPADVSKTGTDRHIRITPRLRRLIIGHAKEGPVIPAGWKRCYQRLRKAAGVGSTQDITRHTFASHYLAAFGDNATKQALGHTAGSDTLFRHYRKAVTEDAGKRYFK